MVYVLFLMLFYIVLFVVNQIYLDSLVCVILITVQMLVGKKRIDSVRRIKNDYQGR